MKYIYISVINFLFLCCLLKIDNLFAFDIPKVKTTSGIVYATKKNKIFLFEDIPYARPPIDNLRWKAPREIINNKIITPKENNFCIQRPSNLGGASTDNNSFFVGTEDCLYLDVFVPRKKFNTKKLPVMFWIHGGGNTSGLKDLYDFSKMVSAHEIIVVRINYRLGPFGWFTHPAVQNFQEGIDKSSNFGTLDIIMALQWTKNNIINFGGDPDNVTIFGESAGGHNVLSLLVSKKAKGLFHKAISMSGYTTSISSQDSYSQSKESSTSEHTSEKIIEKINQKYKFTSDINSVSDFEIRKMLFGLSANDFFEFYSEREPYEEIPLLVADGIVIPKSGLKKSLSNKDHVNVVPTIAGSNRDEVKLWLATARYFVDLDYSLVGSILRIPKVKLVNEDSFEAFNYYRSAAWKIRGVDTPLNSLSSVGNNQLFAYRYDWDDHRRFVIADFKKLIGAAHATEIPLLTGNTDLVGGYPLSDLIYPPSFSKRFTSKNMMLFWTNFAKTGSPGKSSNNVIWQPYFPEHKKTNYIVLDNRKDLKMKNDSVSFEDLINQLKEDSRLNELEKCVALLQMFTYVGEDLYDQKIKKYPNNCLRSDSEQFLKDNASFIEY